ncbi:hypothetical protein D3C85_857310 [compost metagenome]
MKLKPSSLCSLTSSAYTAIGVTPVAKPSTAGALFACFDLMSSAMRFATLMEAIFGFSNTLTGSFSKRVSSSKFNLAIFFIWILMYGAVNIESYAQLLTQDIYFYCKYFYKIELMVQTNVCSFLSKNQYEHTDPKVVRKSS